MSEAYRLNNSQLSLEYIPVRQNSRPINVGIIDLLAFKWPIAAITSITHRIAGVVLFVGIGFTLFALELSLSSEAGFESLLAILSSPAGKFVTWGLLSALAYHFVAGVKHLLMDAGVGETLEGGKFAAQVTIFFSVILIALAAIWVV
jgi:succinate dehydrogenase / fumarate reductase cytochrome b subunit